MRTRLLPTEHAQNQVENKEGADQDESREEDPRPLHTYSIIHLGREGGGSRERREGGEEGEEEGAGEEGKEEGEEVKGERAVRRGRRERGGQRGGRSDEGQRERRWEEGEGDREKYIALLY